MRVVVTVTSRIMSVALGLVVGSAAAQVVSFDLRQAEPVTLPVLIDSNSAMFWRDGKLHVYSSSGDPILNIFDGQFQLLSSEKVKIDTLAHFPMWIESIWEDTDGTLYAWYHYEQIGLCPNLNVPVIGALVSRDAGRSFTDLGVVMSSGEPLNCLSRNGYFAGGHGDFSVIPDRDQQYFYFLFGVYDGDVTGQGVAIARMPFGNRENPIGAVQKYYEGAWSQPGLGGRVTPVFPATVGWQDSETDSFWGPSIHWNTHLDRFVLVMNRSCCEPGWPQEGVYLSMARELSDPAEWTRPVRILGSGDWYPWVLGLEEGGTSTVGGEIVRLFVRHASDWEIVFRIDAEAPVDPTPEAVEPSDTTEPSAPAEPSPEPTEPSTPNEPSEPGEPSPPAEPGEPSDPPAEPASPSEPAQPDEPAPPEEPA